VSKNDFKKEVEYRAQTSRVNLLVDQLYPVSNEDVAQDTLATANKIVIMNAAVKAVVQKEPQIKDTLILNRAVQKNQDVTYHY